MSTPTPTSQPPAQDPAGPVQVRRALLSVSDKTGIIEFARALRTMGIEIVSTGGTCSTLVDAGIQVQNVEELTGSPEILDGRVKTLHPRLHAGLLARRDDGGHMETLARDDISPIDLVCVNLYPFERTIARIDVTEEEAVENIDVGGPTMIRAAAKNHSSVAVVVKPESYDAVLAELEDANGTISAPTRHWLANEAFAYTARYDAAISTWFSQRYEVFPGHLVTAHEKFLDLSYGENPHQRAALYTEVGARGHVLSRISKLHGKALSFNNILDLDAARALCSEFDEPGCVIVKHNNPCGVAVAETAVGAFEAALACDTQSAFGGVIALNRPVDLSVAQRVSEMFVELIAAPGYEPDALELLQRKAAIRILDDHERRISPIGERDIKRVAGGLLIQEGDRDPAVPESLEVVTETKPTDEQWTDLKFAWRVVRHVRSNAIVLASQGATIGIGAGQMSRVDSGDLAVRKARLARGDSADMVLEGCAVASDAFFPFADGVQTAIDAGARSVIQPGGSKRDDEVIAACNAAGVAMVFTGRRHFRH